MSGEQTPAIVLRTIEFSETSLIVTMLTREFGQVAAIAKGARRPKSSFEGSLDLLAVCRVVVLRKNADTLDLLTEAIRSEATADTNFDLDGSGSLDNNDLTYWVETLYGTLFGDTNLDFEVNLVDLSNLATNFNMIDVGWADGDNNGDNEVNLVDLSNLATNFGAAANVPEPGTLAALALGLGAAGTRRR